MATRPGYGGLEKTLRLNVLKSNKVKTECQGNPAKKRVSTFIVAFF